MMKIGRFLQLIVLIMIAAGAQPALTAVYQWSTTAANNASADPNINWAEGMSPSSVNDSARAMMAAIASARRDWQATLITGGSASAYTITSNQGFTSTSAMNIQMIAFLPHTTNSFGATLNVDGLGNFPIMLDGAGTPIPAGQLSLGTPYVVTFYNGDQTFRLWSVYSNPYNIPLGAYLESSASSPPNANFLAADGSCISRTGYAAYFALVSTTYGGCDGSTTFAVPDRRGRVAGMLDGGAGRLTNAATGCGTTFNSLGVTCGSESQTLTLAQIPGGITSTGAALSVTTVTSAILLSNGIGAQNLASGTNGFGWSNNPTVGTITAAGNTTTGQSVVSTNTGGGAHPNVQPTFGVKVFVRVL